MANPIKASDLYQDDGAIQKAISDLEALQKEYDQAFKKINGQAIRLEVSVKKLNAANAQNREEIQRTAKATDQLAREQEKLQEAYTDNAKQLATLRNLKAEQNRLNKLEAKLANATAGSYEALSAQYSINRIKINKLSKDYLENTAAGRKLVEETKALRDAMKESQAATGNNSLNVGNYTESIKEAIPFVGNLDKAMKALARNPIVAVLGLIVGALGAMFQAFKKTERGAELLARVSGVLSGLFSAFVGIVDQLAGKIVAAFEDPQQAVKDLWAAIKENIVNRFEGLIDLFQAVGKGLKGIWQIDLQKIAEAAREAGTALIQFGTGLDAGGQKDLSDALTETTRALEEQAKAFARLASAQRAVRKENRALSRELEEITTRAELYSRIAADTTASFREQAEAVEIAQKAIEEKARLELQIAQNNLSILNQELALRRANGEEVEDLADRQLAAYQQLKQAERELTLAIRDNAQQRREIARDVFERELDFAIDAFDTIKAVNERRLKDESLSFDQRRAILEETRRLTDEAFQDQIKLTEDYLGQKLDLDQLVLESDQRVIRERLRAADIDDVTFGRILEIIRERKLALQDLTEAEQDLFALQAKNAKEAADAITDELERIADAELQAAEKFLGEAAALKDRSLFEIFGDALGVNSEKQSEFESTLKSGFATAKQELQAFAQARTQAANQAVQAAERETEAARTALETELQLQRDGLANRAETARQELEQAKANQREAEREQARARRAQAVAQAAEQAGNLITATTKIWAQLGFPAALPAVALLWGSFIASKARAFSLAQDQFGEGGFEMLRGGSHQSGNDISLGIGPNGRERRAEGGEAMAIFSKAAVRKYGTDLPEIVNNINRLQLDGALFKTPTIGGPTVIVNGGNSRDMEQDIKAIRRQGEKEIYFDAKGRKVVKYKNLVQIHG